MASRSLRVASRWGAAGLIGAVSLCSGAIARPQDRARDADVLGRVTDQASGVPIRRAWVCSDDRPHSRIPCVPADTAGRFHLRELQAGPQQLLVSCETGRLPMDSRNVDTATIILGEREQLRRDFRVSSTGCDQRPYEAVAGEFTGHWTYGFELDDFVLCTDSTKHASVERRGLRPGETWDLRAGEPYDGGQRLFVRWRGVWVGPRNGLMPYHMVVDSVIELRPPRPGDC